MARTTATALKSDTTQPLNISLADAADAIRVAVGNSDASNTVTSNTVTSDTNSDASNTVTVTVVPPVETVAPAIRTLIRGTTLSAALAKVAVDATNTADKMSSLRDDNTSARQLIGQGVAYQALTLARPDLVGSDDAPAATHDTIHAVKALCASLRNAACEAKPGEAKQDGTLKVSPAAKAVYVMIQAAETSVLYILSGNSVTGGKGSSKFALSGDAVGLLALANGTVKTSSAFAAIKKLVADDTKGAKADRDEETVALGYWLTHAPEAAKYLALGRDTAWLWDHLSQAALDTAIAWGQARIEENAAAVRAAAEKKEKEEAEKNRRASVRDFLRGMSREEVESFLVNEVFAE